MRRKREQRHLRAERGVPRFTCSHRCTGAAGPKIPPRKLYYLFVRSRQRGLSFPADGEQLPPVSPEKSGHETHAAQDPNIFVPEEALHCRKTRIKKIIIKFPLLLPPSVCTSCLLFQLRCCWSLSAGLQAVDIWRDVGPHDPELSVSCSLQGSGTTPNFRAPVRITSVEALPSSHLPAQPTIDTSTQLPSLPSSSTTTLDQKGEDMPSVR